jgi:hypothetical protein
MNINMNMITDVNELNNKLLVLYVFHEYNNRVEHFFNNVIFYDKNVDFIVIINNLNLKINPSVFPSNVKFLTRDNIGFDFGGWSDALLTNNLYKNYKYFIFVNSSVLGPFISSDYKGNWTDIFINGLQENNIKLFGSTINCMEPPYTNSHVQSYIYSMDITTLEYLIKCEIFSMTNYTKSLIDTVHLKEIPMSHKILENGWNIGSLMKYYKNVDFTFKSKKPEDYNITFFDDPMYNRHYKSGLWSPNEIIFIKGNRDIVI